MSEFIEFQSTPPRGGRQQKPPDRDRILAANMSKMLIPRLRLQGALYVFALLSCFFADFPVRTSPGFYVRFRFAPEFIQTINGSVTSNDGLAP